MNLLEHEGKVLLARHGIAIPVGALWPDMPPVSGELMVKAQMPAGRRGKAGGILRAADAAEARAAAQRLLGTEIAGHRVEGIYLEERLAVEQELYLAVAIDREAKRHVLIASGEGGIDIEQVPEAGIVRVPVDPWLGLRPFHTLRLAPVLRDHAAAGALAEVAAGLYRLAVEEDADLVEINPLAVVDGGLVALDAKVVLDDNARFRHPDRPERRQNAHASDLEARIAAAGAVGVEVDSDGDTVAVVSGAGLMMATLDMLVAAGRRVRAVVDLGGAVLSGSQGLEAVLAAIAAARPRVTLVNAFLQTAHCDVFAEGLVAAHRRRPLEGRVVVRLNGRNAIAGRALLASTGFDVHENLGPAIAATAGAEG